MTPLVPGVSGGDLFDLFSKLGTESLFLDQRAEELFRGLPSTKGHGDRGFVVITRFNTEEGPRPVSCEDRLGFDVGRVDLGLGARLLL